MTYLFIVLLSHKSETFALGKIKKFQGKEMKYAGDDRIIAVFMDADDVVRCAVEMRAELRKKSKDHKEDEWNIPFKTGISGGQSISGNEGSFEQVIQFAQRLR